MTKNWSGLLFCTTHFATQSCTFILHMSLRTRKMTVWVLTRSDVNWPLQSQKQARSLTFWIYEVKGLYYLCSENKGADQLRGYREAGLRLCFRICKLLLFLCGGSCMKIGERMLVLKVFH